MMHASVNWREAIFFIFELLGNSTILTCNLCHLYVVVYIFMDADYPLVQAYQSLNVHMHILIHN